MLLTLVLQLPFLALAFVSAPLHNTRHRGDASINVSIQRTSPLLANNITDAPTEESSLLIQDSTLLVVDVISIALASQLLGLADTLNDPEFWQQGGWLQPISTTESTLPTLVQRDSILTICWLLAALTWKGYNNKEDESTDEVQLILQIATSFCALRVALGFVVSMLGHADFGVWDSIRQCYFTIILVGSFRFLYSQYIR